MCDLVEMGCVVSVGPDLSVHVCFQKTMYIYMSP